MEKRVQEVVTSLTSCARVLVAAQIPNPRSVYQLEEFIEAAKLSNLIDIDLPWTLFMSTGYEVPFYPILPSAMPIIGTRSHRCVS